MQILELDEDVVALDAQRIAGGFCSRRMRSLAGGQIEFPLVPGADDFAVLNGTFGERAAAMRADIVERQGNSLQRGHAESVTLNGELFGLGFRWKLLPTAQSDPLTHPGTLSLHGFDAIRGGADSSNLPAAVEQGGNMRAVRRGELHLAELRWFTVRGYALSLDCGHDGAAQNDEHPPANDHDGGAAAFDLGNDGTAKDQQQDHPQGEDVRRRKECPQPQRSI